MNVPFPYARASLEAASTVIFGAPDESGSRAPREGAQLGPFHIRKTATEHNLFCQHGQRSLVQPLRGAMPALHDLGNVRKKDIAPLVRQLADEDKTTVMLGGDHSCTLEALKGFTGTPLHLVYVDAHPDMVSSRGSYYGSVVWDALQHSLLKSVTHIGLRCCETEEIANMKNSNAAVFDMVALEEKGIKPVLKHLKALKGPVYLSFDLDAIDPAFAPGVSAPHPGGLTLRESLQIVRAACGRDIKGMDVMELCPPYDSKGRTAHVAAEVLLHALSTLGDKR